MADKSDRSVIIGILDLLRASFWPAVVLFIVLQFLEPLKETISVLPDVLKRTKSLVVAGNSIEVNSATPSPTSDVKDVLANIDDNSLRYLLERSPDMGHVDCINRSISEAEKTSLIQFKLLDRTPILHDPNCPTSTKLTDLGRRTREYLIDLVLTQIVKTPRK